MAYSVVTPFSKFARAIVVQACREIGIKYGQAPYHSTGVKLWAVRADSAQLARLRILLDKAFSGLNMQVQVGSTYGRETSVWIRSMDAQRIRMRSLT